MTINPIEQGIKKEITFSIGEKNLQIDLTALVSLLVKEKKVTPISILNNLNSEQVNNIKTRLEAEINNGLEKEYSAEDIESEIPNLLVYVIEKEGLIRGNELDGEQKTIKQFIKEVE